MRGAYARRASDEPADFDLEQRIRPGHAPRPTKTRVDGALREMSRALTAAYSPLGRPSIPPEQLLKALLL